MIEVPQKGRICSIDMEGCKQAHAKFHHQHGARDNYRASVEPSKPVPLLSIVLFDPISPVLADVVLANRKCALVRCIIVCTIRLNIPALETFKKSV